ncbi:Probable inorganic phosphate transporter 1-8 [Seminavis robusta]|uniref:Probable inorganic phosphate transporter 1-8 n=1 Tax=Seminavis robusta TaxID=568900 RepID=A0A9N8EMQ5_9STRA|nr:Probable inorganic phosphate transporter 1-8 [Seminavis robusta]|eukprot:Sro1348_g265050.1 Probable inorganic phosphate transporter 1-8 (666) ;mRNA; r:24727-26798
MPLFEMSSSQDQPKQKQKKRQQHPSQPPKPQLPQDASSEPRSLCHQFLLKSVWPGLGLFGESYLLFSIGTLKPLWEILYPDCFSGETCSSTLLGSLTYSVVLGVMVGMVALGYAANHLGRRTGSIITASIMAFGAWGVTLVSIFLTDREVWLYRALSMLFFVFGLGVGGEYPLSASSASEYAMGALRHREAQEMQQHDTHNNYSALYENALPTTATTPIRNNTSTHNEEHRQQHRGRHIQLVFSMQGVGILCNSVTMTALLWITGISEQQQQQAQESLLMIWRITYALGALVLTFVLWSRWQYLQESHVWDEDRKKRYRIQQSRSTLLEEAIKSRKQEELLQLDAPIVRSSSSVSSLSAPSVTVDYYNQAIHTTGLPTQHHHNHHHHQHVSNLAVPAADTPPPQEDHQDNSSNAEDDLKSSPTRLFLQNYGLRLMGASLSWLAWDVCFYGNKLFQSTFLLTLTGESTTLIEFSMAASLNAAVALLGYFGAALLVDKVGRRDLQQYGFLVTGSLFVSCGFLYNDLSSATLVTLYLASSFFGQLGPNATTFMLAAELFPTEMRTMAHGICACAGKAGALIAAVVFNYLDNDLDLFMLSGYASFVACFITFCTIPETLGLDLYEVDKKWRMTLEGRKVEYRGDANHPRYLSYLERSKLHGVAHCDVDV